MAPEVKLFCLGHPHPSLLHFIDIFVIYQNYTFLVYNKSMVLREYASLFAGRYLFGGHFDACIKTA
jgi:hypothetical protein